MSGPIDAFGQRFSLNDVVDQALRDQDPSANDRPDWAPGLSCDLIMGPTQTDDYGRRLRTLGRLYMKFDQAEPDSMVVDLLQIYSRFGVGGPTEHLTVGESRRQNYRELGIGVGQEIKVVNLREHRAKVTHIVGTFLNRERY